MGWHPLSCAFSAAVFPHDARSLPFIHFKGNAVYNRNVLFAVAKGCYKAVHPQYGTLPMALFRISGISGACRSCARSSAGPRLYGTQFNIAAFPARLKLNARVFIVPFTADDCRIVAIHSVLHRSNRLAVVFLPEGFALKHQVIRCGKGDHIKAFRHGARIIRLRRFWAPRRGNPCCSGAPKRRSRPPHNKGSILLH